MNVAALAAVAYALTVALVVAFQLALAAGVPWGAYAMGGAAPGRFPAPLRVAALVQAGLLVATIAIVLARAGVIVTDWAGASRGLIWVMVGVAVVGLVLNAISTSAGERRLWVPGTAVMLATSLVVALAGA